MIQRELQNPLATELLEGRIQDGDTVRVSASALGLLLEPPHRADPPKPPAPPPSEGAGLRISRFGAAFQTS